MIPPDQEIFEVEKRIADRRHRVEAAAKQTARQTLRALTSPWALAGAAVVGFLVAGGIQRRHAHAHDTRVDPSTKKAAKASAVSGLAMTGLTWLIKSQFGSPVAMAQFFLAKLKKEPDPRRTAPGAPSPAVPPSSRDDRLSATTRR